MKGFFEHSTKVILIGTSLLISACANSPANNPYALGTGSTIAALTNGTSSGASSCAAGPNVLPIDDTYLNGSDQWTVCPNPTTATTIMVSGFTEVSDQICVFPAESTALGVVPITNVTIQCPMVSTNGMTVSYPNITFNAAFIVASKYSQQMYQCLTVGSTCPPYSYGEFR